jgi:hypothetical protein
LAASADVPAGALFRFVRLRDWSDGATSRAPFAGPDIDAIGAIGADTADADADDIHDDGDNCPTASNTDQADADRNGVGDVCEGAQPESSPGAEVEGNGAEVAENGADDEEAVSCSCRLPGAVQPAMSGSWALLSVAVCAACAARRLRRRRAVPSAALAQPAPR